jgi:hypothetical protein
MLNVRVHGTVSAVLFDDSSGRVASALHIGAVFEARKPSACDEPLAP